jgi:hypothetical protein
MRDQITELYRTMEQYGLIPKEAAPVGEAVVVKKRGRPPKRPEVMVAPAGAGEEAPAAPAGEQEESKPAGQQG